MWLYLWIYNESVKTRQNSWTKTACIIDVNGIESVERLEKKISFIIHVIRSASSRNIWCFFFGLTEYELLTCVQSWISEWFSIKTIVRNVYGHFLKHSNGNSNVCNVLAFNDLNLYTPNGTLIKPNKLKSKGIISQLSRTYNIHLKTELNWGRKLEVNYIDWKNVWENVYSSNASVKAKQFQWKYIHNVIFTEDWC